MGALPPRKRLNMFPRDPQVQYVSFKEWSVSGPRLGIVGGGGVSLRTRLSPCLRVFLPQGDSVVLPKDLLPPKADPERLGHRWSLRPVSGTDGRTERRFPDVGRDTTPGRSCTDQRRDPDRNQGRLRRHCIYVYSGVC